MTIRATDRLPVGESTLLWTGSEDEVPDRLWPKLRFARPSGSAFLIRASETALRRLLLTPSGPSRINSRSHPEFLGRRCVGRAKGRQRINGSKLRALSWPAVDQRQFSGSTMVRVRHQRRYEVSIGITGAWWTAGASAHRRYSITNGSFPSALARCLLVALDIRRNMKQISPRSNVPSYCGECPPIHSSRAPEGPRLANHLERVPLPAD